MNILRHVLRVLAARLQHLSMVGYHGNQVNHRVVLGANASVALHLENSVCMVALLEGRVAVLSGCRLLLKLNHLLHLMNSILSHKFEVVFVWMGKLIFDITRGL